MAVDITGTYRGGLSVELTHGPSGQTWRTAAPVDNQGDGSSFSPTDMVAGALGACMLTILAIVAERDGLDVSGLTFRVEKHMQSGPRRIASLPIRLTMPAGLNATQRRKLERAALTCPVHHSLLPDIDIKTHFDYPD